VPWRQKKKDAPHRTTGQHAEAQRKDLASFSVPWDLHLITAAHIISKKKLHIKNAMPLNHRALERIVDREEAKPEALQVLSAPGFHGSMRNQLRPQSCEATLTLTAVVEEERGEHACFDRIQRKAETSMLFGKGGKRTMKQVCLTTLQEKRHHKVSCRALGIHHGEFMILAQLGLHSHLRQSCM
jgi:hypothetical protein